MRQAHCSLVTPCWTIGRQVHWSGPRYCRRRGTASLFDLEGRTLMSAQRNVRERVCALNTITGFKTAITAPASAVAAALICFGMVSAAQGAAETKLKEANTSIGVLPTNATNQWKLITDPVITTPDATPSDEVVFDPMNYYVVSGSLDNSYDASKFHLLTDSDGNYATGVTAEGAMRRYSRLT